ncbi:hypothetical protein BaRGS_00011936 [Batillaria attramentaria]|uniref:Cyclase n=1 Tax=Batillaria attramentaria TaxID=370345 RepID=A0ABD0LC93_9CAEN
MVATVPASKGIVWLVCVTSCWAALTVIDMTHEFGDDAVYYPGNPPFNFTVLVKGYQPEGYWLEYNAFATAEHGGTHADAPGHFYRGSWKAHEIPAQNLVGPAVVVDVRKQVASNPNYLMTVEDLLVPYHVLGFGGRVVRLC